MFWFIHNAFKSFIKSLHSFLGLLMYLLLFFIPPSSLNTLSALLTCSSHLILFGFNLIESSSIHTYQPLNCLINHHIISLFLINRSAFCDPNCLAHPLICFSVPISRHLSYADDTVTFFMLASQFSTFPRQQ